MYAHSNQDKHLCIKLLQSFASLLCRIFIMIDNQCGEFVMCLAVYSKICQWARQKLNIEPRQLDTTVYIGCNK
jgi:hypothetical protein